MMIPPEDDDDMPEAAEQRLALQDASGAGPSRMRKSLDAFGSRARPLGRSERKHLLQLIVPAEFWRFILTFSRALLPQPPAASGCAQTATPALPAGSPALRTRHVSSSARLASPRTTKSGWCGRPPPSQSRHAGSVHSYVRVCYQMSTDTGMTMVATAAAASRRRLRWPPRCPHSGLRTRRSPHIRCMLLPQSARCQRRPRLLGACASRPGALRRTSRARAFAVRTPEFPSAAGVSVGCPQLSSVVSYSMTPTNWNPVLTCCDRLPLAPQ